LFGGTEVGKHGAQQLGEVHEIDLTCGEKKEEKEGPSTPRVPSDRPGLSIQCKRSPTVVKAPGPATAISPEAHRSYVNASLLRRLIRAGMSVAHQ
jgi:hypothetical protein